MQPFDTPDLDIEPHEAFELVICELHSHAATGRKNFVVRVPQDMVIYLFTGILRKADLSKVVLERELSELGLYGFKDADGRILRRYLSGETRMAWETYRRLVFWALANKWISDWVFRDLLLSANLREAAQRSARTLLNKVKRRVSLAELTREQIIDCFKESYRQVLQEIEALAVSRVGTDRDIRELARSLGLEFQD
ncbi:hypothetical protein DNK06_24020 [Pseudomonas daroniae]|uniref:Uncharacterized protein n=1 Tax=Phytopseudomonas daroniae TaxID=2487519 RepID=A0A4Q9QG35_9GAMM|nr:MULTISPECIES: hypothetical protein [Pseudomonas]TBU71434.1 hypothetical protein DNK06_24020 [Pseudomonas daroniae]TBU74760.1 hypothetical protein DNK31_23845 [Pseudomonas sp. FRB 228]TBU86651.1 hypothetical protein DNJ99_23875 [Pseudomonas daroniae]